MQVANTILNQLGGHRFLVMTGAKSLLAGESELQFDLPRNFAKDGINKVRIHLSANDTYLVSFYKVANRGLKVAVIAQAEGVYADQLQTLFTAKTGLNTSL